MTSGKSLIFLFTSKQSNECCESNTPLAKLEGEIEFLTIGSGASGSSGDGWPIPLMDGEEFGVSSGETSLG